jgi:hypothetical protein
MMPCWLLGVQFVAIGGFFGTFSTLNSSATTATISNPRTEMKSPRGVLDLHKSRF